MSSSMFLPSSLTHISLYSSFQLEQNSYKHLSQPQLQVQNLKS